MNNRPFVVRQQDQPFVNLEITGIEPHEVEAMEDRLKADILRVFEALPPITLCSLCSIRPFCSLLTNMICLCAKDAAHYNGLILLHEENDEGRLVGHWEK